MQDAGSGDGWVGWKACMGTLYFSLSFVLNLKLLSNIESIIIIIIFGCASSM